MQTSEIVILLALGLELSGPAAVAAPEQIKVYPVVSHNDVFLFYDRKDANIVEFSRCLNAVAMTADDIRALKRAYKSRKPVTLIVNKHVDYISGMDLPYYSVGHYVFGNRSINPMCESRDLYEIKAIVGGRGRRTPSP